MNDIIKFLGEHVELRYNQITMRVEYRMKVEGEGKGEDSSTPRLWQIINDRAVNTLWSEMSKTNRAAVQDFFRVIESNYVQPFNPFIDYLGSLPEWHEGDTDYIQQLADSVTIKGGEEQQKLWTSYLRKWLVGMLAGWTLDDVVNNVIIVLIGAQGSGKSTWIAMVLPPQATTFSSSPILRAIVAGCPSRWRASSRPVSIPSTIPTSMPRRCICCAQASDIGLRSKRSSSSTFTTTSLRHPVWSENSLRSTSPIPPRSSMVYS